MLSVIFTIKYSLDSTSVPQPAHRKCCKATTSLRLEEDTQTVNLHIYPSVTISLCCMFCFRSSVAVCVCIQGDVMKTWVLAEQWRWSGSVAGPNSGTPSFWSSAWSLLSGCRRSPPHLQYLATGRRKERRTVYVSTHPACSPVNEQRLTGGEPIGWSNCLSAGGFKTMDVL